MLYIILLNILLNLLDQVEKTQTLNFATADHDEIESSISADHGRNLVQELEADNLVEAVKTSRMYIFMAFFILSLSVLAAYYLNREHSVFSFLSC